MLCQIVVEARQGLAGKTLSRIPRRRRPRILQVRGLRSRIPLEFFWTAAGLASTYSISLTFLQSLFLYRIKGFASCVFGDAFKLILYAHQLVVLGDPVGAAHGAGFDLPGLKGHYEVGDKGVFGLA